MDVAGILAAYLTLIWPVLVAGIIIFAIWGAAKAGAQRAGYHLGIAGVGLVFVVLAFASAALGQPAIALLLFFVGAVILAVAFHGEAR